jgi:uncharacterized protein YvpB
MRRAPTLAAVATLMIALAGGIVVPRVDAEGLRSVDAWIELSSVRPSIGCTLDVSVEVRDAGFAVTQTEVSLALFVDGDVVGADTAVTDGDGIAYLAVDTSGAYAGADAWLDVNVASAYLGGHSISPAADGGCEGDGKLIEVSGDVPAVQVEAVTDDTDRIGPSGDDAVSIWVPTYGQQRNLSCEYASLHIATSAWGNGVSEYAFDDVVGRSDNPHWGYRGDINGWWGNVDDYGVYAEPLAAALDQFGFSGDVFYSGGDAGELTSRLDAGIPVLVWLSLWGDQSVFDESEGVTYQLVAGEHVMVAYGYDDDGVYLSDPAIAGYRFYSWGDFTSMWGILDGMGLGVSPA